MSNTGAQRREIGRIVQRLRVAIGESDIRRFAEELHKEASADLLTAIREQKLILKARPTDRDAVAAVLRATVGRVLTEMDANYYRAYLDFIEVWSRSQFEVSSRLSLVLGLLPKTDTNELLWIFEKALGRFLENFPGRPSADSLSVAEYERRLHDLNGLGNDIIYAAVRALNEASRTMLEPTKRRLSKAVRDRALRRFVKLIQIAAELNGLEWILDLITYGDCVVSKVESYAAPRVRLDYADVRRSLLRELAIRRDLVLNLNRARAPRYVRDMLKASEVEVLNAAVAYYAEVFGVNPTEIDHESLLYQSGASLTFVSAEDDLLMAAAASVGDGRPAAYYLSAMCLRWFELASAAVSRKLPRQNHSLVSTRVLPISYIKFAIARSDDTHVAEAIESLLNVLPTKSHYDLVRRPFLQLPSGEVRSVPADGYSLWTMVVREALISGGVIGDAYGRMWEDFYAKSFEESDWLVVGRNLTLRRAGMVATDIDLLLKREDLLLVVQVKALIGSGVSCYDHWRNRKTIEWGCRQAAVAAEFIRTQPDWLVSVGGRGVAQEVKQIQPLVLTTLDSFDGWRFEGVPVIGEAGRKAITVGAKVDYTDPRSGSVVTTRWITKPEELSTERILWSLDNPVEMLIAPEGLSTTHRAATVSGITILLPAFELRNSVESYPAILKTNEPGECDNA